LAQEGKRVLVVTFNITILHYLRDLCARAGAGHPNDITWLNFHAVCKRLVKSLGLEERYNALWREHYSSQPGKLDNEDERVFNAIPEMLLDAIAKDGLGEGERYDAILVDEAQDYQPIWWQLLRKLHAPNGEMLLVADATQDVYGTAKLWTEGVMSGAGFSGNWSSLPSSYRLPADLLPLVVDFARRFLPAGDRLDPIRPQSELEIEPCRLRWVQARAQDPATIATCVDELLDIMKGDIAGSHSMSDLCVIADKIANGRRIVAALNKEGIKTSETFGQIGDAQEDRRKKLAFWKGRSAVKVSTLHSFKGWEARFIVLHLTKANSPQDLAVIYAGLTRLKRHPEGSFLTVVCNHAAFEEYGRTWPEFRTAPS
jgi:superfamily I DNA/RNA helicase